MGFFSLFAPAPHISPIQDKNTIDKSFKYWRWRTFYSMFIGYAVFYFTRKSYAFAMPLLSEELGYDKSQLGSLATVLFLTYGFSKFVSGVLSDKSNPRYFMSVGLIITGICNICFGLSSSLLFFAIFWGLNGWFQGHGWAPIARLLTHWYSTNERGSWWSSWNVSHNVGGALIAIIVGFSAYYWGWRWGFFVPGIISIGVGFFLMNRLRDTPQSIGLPSVEEWREDYSDKNGVKNSEEELSTKQILFDYVLNNKWIWLLAIAYFFVYVVRTALNDWSVLYLKEVKGYDLATAGAAVFMFECGGFIGSLAAGFGSDWLFGGKRSPVNVLFSLGLVFSVFGFWCVPVGYPALDFLSLFFIGFFVFGPQMLIGIAAVEASHKKAAATASGFAGWFAYFGAAFTGYPLGKIADSYGWNGCFQFLIGCSVVALLLLIPTFIKERRAQKIETQLA